MQRTPLPAADRPSTRDPRAECLLDIGRLLLSCDDVDRSVDAALSVAARCVSIRAAVLLDASGPAPRLFRWPAGSAETTDADADARVPPGGVAMPLSVDGSGTFGVLHVDVAAPVTADDLAFFDATTKLLAVAVAGMRARAQATARRAAAERAELDLVRATTDSLCEGVVAIDLQERVTFCNQAAANLLSCGTTTVIGAPLADLLRVRRADGSPVEPPQRTVLRRGGRLRDEHVRIVRGDDGSFPARLTCTPLLRDGRTAGVVLAFEDVSARVRSDADTAFLLRAEEVLGAQLRGRALVPALARLCVPQLGDVCFVDLRDGDGDVVRAAWAHALPEGQSALDALYGGAAACAFARHPAARAMRARSVVLAPFVAAHGGRGEDADVLRMLDARSSLVAPLVHGDRALGALTFLRIGGSRRHDGGDLGLAVELARRGALAVESAHRYDAACRAVELRDEVLQVVSHDLRNPIATVLLNLDVARRRAPQITADGALLSSLDRIASPVARMRRLVDDLLDYANIEKGRLSMRRARHDVAALLAEAVVAHEAAARLAGVTLAVETERDVPPIWCDGDRVLQVLGNLLGNALTATPSGGAVSLRARRGRDAIVVSVADTGPGVTPDDAAHVFDRFFRGAQAGYKGTGLGLAICRAIVAAHGGRIWVESPRGGGATFSFSLPARDDEG